MVQTVSQTIGPVTVRLISDCRVAAAIIRDGQFEPFSLNAWVGTLVNNPAMIVVDVGSYSGIYSITAALLGHQAFAIEPKARMAQRIHENALLNNVEVKVSELAASDKTGKAVLHYKGQSPLTSVSSLKKQRQDNASCEVTTTRIDDLGIKGGRVAAIKIDVEGHEMAVIRGAAKLIAKHRPIMLIETLEDESRKAKTIKMLPDYRAVAFCDLRNLLMEPL